jgi:hypothetical protein
VSLYAKYHEYGRYTSRRVAAISIPVSYARDDSLNLPGAIQPLNQKRPRAASTAGDMTLGTES